MTGRSQRSLKRLGWGLEPSPAPTNWTPTEGRSSSSAPPADLVPYAVQLLASHGTALHQIMEQEETRRCYLIVMGDGTGRRPRRNASSWDV